MRVFTGVGLAYVTSLSSASLNWQSLSDLGLWLLAVLPLFVAGILSSLKCGELASMLVTGGGAGGSGPHGRGNGRRVRRQGRHRGGEYGSPEKMNGKKTESKDAGQEYAEIWGEAIHSNRHLRVLSIGLGGVVLLLVIVVFRIVSVEPPRPIVVRVDEIGRAEAIAYEAMEAQADPLDPTTKYFLNRFIHDFYSRRRATVGRTLVPQFTVSEHRSCQREFQGRESEHRPSRGGSGQG